MLASIQKITKLTPIPDADKIEKASILGWEVVVLKDKFKEGQLVVYIATDTVVPNIPEFAFLLERKFRVTTIKLRKQISQGLIVDPKEFGIKKLVEGDDVSEIIGVTKYEKEANIANTVSRPKPPKHFFRKMVYLFKYRVLYALFPSMEKKYKIPFPSDLVSKTDEERIQNIPNILEEYKGQHFSASEKLNGSSITIIFDKNHLRVCSRNWEFVDPENEWTRVAHENGFGMKLEALANYIGTDLVVAQGEYIGKPQANYYKIPDNRIYLFNLFIAGQPKLPPKEFQHLCKMFDIPFCPEISLGPLEYTMESILQAAQFKSTINPAVEAEGLVFRSVEAPVVSFKVVSNKYLLKNGE